MQDCCNIIMTGGTAHILHQKEEGHLTKYMSGPVWSHAPTINYEAKMVVATTLHVQLYFYHYTALQTENSIRSVSTINHIAMENTGDKLTQPQLSHITLYSVN